MLPQDIVARLSTEELEIVAPALRIRSDDIDQARSGITTPNDLLVVSFFSASGACCPFDWIFSRRDSPSAFSMGVGLGGSLFHWDRPKGPDDRQGFAKVVWEFLTSTVRCKKRTTRKGDVRADYWLGNCVMHGKPEHLRYGANLWPWVHYPVEIIEYAPWLPEEAPPGGISAPWPPESER